MGNKEIIDLSDQSELLEWAEPLILDLNKIEDFYVLDDLKKSGKVTRVIDNADFVWEELFDIQNPAKKDTKTKNEVKNFSKDLIKGAKEKYGYWIYFPWNGFLVHFPNKVDLRKLRTSRNRNLIKEDEQAKLYDCRILVLGLSVGSNVIEAIVSQGIGNVIGLVDLDILEPSNLNRIRLPFHEIGQHKVDAIAKRISEIDPFIQQLHFREGINEENFKEMLLKVKPDIIVDEMDDLRMKILIREYALTKKIPVVMATDDGDDVLLDIERFDKGVNSIFHDTLPLEIRKKIKDNKITDRSEIGKIIGEYFVGFENVPLRMIESLKEVGITLPSWPQLGGAAALAGLMVAFAIKKIILGEDIKSTRYLCGPSTVKEVING